MTDNTVIHLPVQDVALGDGARYLDSHPAPYTFYDPVENGGTYYTFNKRTLTWSNSVCEFVVEFQVRTTTNILKLSVFDTSTNALIAEHLLNSPLGFGQQDLAPTIGSFNGIAYGYGAFALAWAINYSVPLGQYGYTYLQVFDNYGNSKNSGGNSNYTRMLNIDRRPIASNCTVVA